VVDLLTPDTPTHIPTYDTAAATNVTSDTDKLATHTRGDNNEPAEVDTGGDNLSLSTLNHEGNDGDISNLVSFTIDMN
jgi:hypothetical protein